MARMERYELSDGSQVLVEMEDVAGGGPVGVHDRVDDARRTLRQALAALPSLIRDVHEMVIAHVPQPDQIVVEFGAKVSGELGVVVAKSQAEANFKISVSWKHSTGA